MHNSIAPTRCTTWSAKQKSTCLNVLAVAMPLSKTVLFSKTLTRLAPTQLSCLIFQSLDRSIGHKLYIKKATGQSPQVLIFAGNHEEKLSKESDIVENYKCGIPRLFLTGGALFCIYVVRCRCQIAPKIFFKKKKVEKKRKEKPLYQA
jgi:hypothetical protein